MRRLTLVEYGDRFFARGKASALPATSVAALAEQLLQLLRSAPAATGEAAGPLVAAADVARWPVFPSAAGQLHLASELCDPGVPELRQLMDPSSHFPAGALIGISGDRTAALEKLEVMASLGMRRTVDLTLLLEAATDISARFGTLQAEHPELASAAAAGAANGNAAGGRPPTSG